VNLTPKQFRVLEYIREFRRSHGFSPTLDEIGRAFGVSKITVLQHLRALEKRGAIRRTRYRARSIELCAPVMPSAGVPVEGTLVEGEPIQAPSEGEALDLNRVMQRSKDLFALRVRGHFLAREQLRDGDYLLCERGEEARHGDLVVVVLKDGSAALGRVHQEGEGPARFQPIDPQAAPLDLEQLSVRGCVVGVFRKY